MHFQLQEVELEIALGTTYGGDGEVNLAVVQLGSNIAKEHTHTVRLSFLIPEGASSVVKSGSRYYRKRRKPTRRRPRSRRPRD